MSSWRGWYFWRGDNGRRDNAAADCDNPEHDFFHCASPFLGSRETLMALQEEDQKPVLELKIGFTGAHLWAAVHDAVHAINQRKTNCISIAKEAVE
ncbi:hypothetical protein [Hyphomicrobium facile]|nr:hypothetical protein [Hyphomicrobium facile]